MGGGVLFCLYLTCHMTYELGIGSPCYINQYKNMYWHTRTPPTPPKSKHRTCLFERLSVTSSEYSLVTEFTSLQNKINILLKQRQCVPRPLILLQTRYRKIPVLVRRAYTFSVYPKHGLMLLSSPRILCFSDGFVPVAFMYKLLER